MDKNIYTGAFVWVIVAKIFFGTAAATTVFSFYRDLRRGYVSSKSGVKIYYRDANPAMYWGSLGMYVLIFLASVGFVLGLFSLGSHR